MRHKEEQEELVVGLLNYLRADYTYGAFLPISARCYCAPKPFHFSHAKQNLILKRPNVKVIL